MKKRFFIRFRFPKLVTLFIVSLLVVAGPLSAQNISVMLQQIAKLELLLKETEKGYSIVQQGLNTIAQIKKGDFDLHSLFFSSLMTVNPAIKNWGKVADIVAMEVQILLGCGTTLQEISSSGSFTPTDITYVTAVYSNLKNLTLKDIDELTGVITDGNWQMTDDQRMSRIDKLYNTVCDKYTFLRAFTNRILNQSQLRTQEQGSLQNLSKLF